MKLEKKDNKGKVTAIVAMCILTASLPVILWVSDFLRGIPLPVWAR